MMAHQIANSRGAALAGFSQAALILAGTIAISWLLSAAARDQALAQGIVAWNECRNDCTSQYEACLGDGWPGFNRISECIEELGPCLAQCHLDPPPDGPLPDSCPVCGDPVSTGSGLFMREHTDLTLDDVIPINFAHVYRQTDTATNSFGAGMTDNYNYYINADPGGSYTYADLYLPDAGRVRFTRISSGDSYFNAIFQDSATPGKYFGATISWNGSAWVLRMKDGTQMTFGNAGAVLSAITDRNGNTVTINRNLNTSNDLNNPSGWLSAIVSPNDRAIYFTTDSNGRITQAQDNLGRTVTYGYNAGGHLSAVTDANGGVTTYGYDSGGRLNSITTPRNNRTVSNAYDASGHVIQQTHADGGTYGFDYTLNGNQVSSLSMTDPNGVTDQFAFSSGLHYQRKLGLRITRTTDYKFQSRPQQ